MSINVPVPPPLIDTRGLSEFEYKLCKEIEWLLAHMPHQRSYHTFGFQASMCTLCKRVEKIKAILRQRPYIPQAPGDE